MTNKEGVRILTHLWTKNSLNIAETIAVEKAIKALEAQPCEDCISREKAKQFLYERIDRLNDDELYDIFSRIIDDMYNELSPAIPKPKTGRWINLEKTKYKGQVLPFWCRYGCSKCGGHGEGSFNYCPNCGADMRESEDKDKE